MPCSLQGYRAATAGDPVGIGLVASLARPGENVTHGRDASVSAVALRQPVAMRTGKELSPDALPSAIIRRNFVITTSGVCAPGPLAEAIAALGEDSVMFSVDNIFDES
jgi:hypothetical protein